MAARRDARPSGLWRGPAAAWRERRPPAPGSRHPDSRALLPNRGSIRCARAAARPSLEHETEHPALRALLGDAWVKTGAVGWHAGLLRLLHLERREPTDRPRHVSPQFSPRWSCGICPVAGDGSRRGLPFFLGVSY